MKMDLMKNRKTRIKKRKRLTPMAVILRGVLLSAAISAVAVGAFGAYIDHLLYVKGNESADMTLSNVQSSIMKINEKPDVKDPLKLAASTLSMYTTYELYLMSPVFPTEASSVGAWVCYDNSPTSHAVSALVDETRKKIVGTNEFLIVTGIDFGENDPSTGRYLCTLDLLESPELGRLYKDYNELIEAAGNSGIVKTNIESIYYDPKSKTFIPRRGSMTLLRFKNGLDTFTAYKGGGKSEETREIKIDLDSDEYKDYKVLKNRSEEELPNFLEPVFTGEKPEVIAEIMKGVTRDRDETWSPDDSYFPKEGEELFETGAPVMIAGKRYTLHVSFLLDKNDPQLRAYRLKWSVIFSAVITAAVMLLYWRRYVLSKAQYAFEDHQKELTDHLAHDIKTPLTAIGGYAENILDGKLTDAEKERYLRSILDNVAFTDSIVNRTLCLNRMDDMPAAKREKLSAEDIIEAAFGKYKPLLEENSISYSCTGSAEITAERGSFEMLIENLVSNAVKYTSEGGSIRASVGKKSITITNTVERYIDTSELKRPFVRGDAARSNRKGSGLGLSIADRAAEANGLRLDLSCTEKEFCAALA